MYFYFDGILMLTLVSQAALFTMLYSDSLARFVFDGDENFSVSYLPSVGESGVKIVTSLAILAVPSIFSGYFLKDFFIGFGSFIFADSIFVNASSAHFYESDYLPAAWRLIPVAASFFSVFLAILGFDFLRKPFSFFLLHFTKVYLVLRGALQFVFDFFSLNWFFDACLNYWVVKIFLNFCKEVSFTLLDKGVLEVFGPYALSNAFARYSRKFSRITSGYIYHYAFFIILGVSSLFLLVFFIAESVSFEFFFMQFVFFLIFFINFDSSKFFK